eukprot:8574823-Lingulodinium_polyedra.AAC.1
MVVSPRRNARSPHSNPRRYHQRHQQQQQHHHHHHLQQLQRDNANATTEELAQGWGSSTSKRST